MVQWFNQVCNDKHTGKHFVGACNKEKKYAGEEVWGKQKKKPQTKKKGKNLKKIKIKIFFSSLIPKVGNTSGFVF